MDTSETGMYYSTPADVPPRLELRFLRQESPRPSSTAESARPELAHDVAAHSIERNAKAQVEVGRHAHSADGEGARSRVPPDGGRTAWTQVFASFLINMNVSGLVNAFGDFQHFYETEDCSGRLLTLLVGALAGPIFDKGYFTITLQIASVVLVFSWMMLSLSSQYYQIMLTQGILAGICVGLMEVPSIALIPDYFKKRLGLALGLAISGAPMGGLIYSVVFRALLSATDFGWATRTIGFVVFVTLGIAILLIRPLESIRKSTSRNFFDLSAFREAPFICIFIDAFFAYVAALVPYFITPAFAVSLGTSSNTATYLVAVLNGAQLFGRVVPNWLSDYYGGADMLLFAQTLIGVLGLHWITIATLGGFVEFLIFTGFISGMVATLPATVIPYICPKPETLGTRIGMIYASAGLEVLIGNPVALALTGDTSKREGFLGAQLWMGLCALIGAAFFVVTARSAKRNWAAIMGGREEQGRGSPWEDLVPRMGRRTKRRRQQEV